MIIKLSVNAKGNMKMNDRYGLIEQAILIQIFLSDYIDLTAEFRDYDGNFGSETLPLKGACIVLVFQKTHKIFTVVVPYTEEREILLKETVGHYFHFEFTSKNNMQNETIFN